MKIHFALHAQQGMALVIGMIFIVVLTLIGVAAVNSTILSEKMTHNMHDLTVAFDSAESALTDGEQWLQSAANAPTPISTCDSPPCDVWDIDTAGTVHQNSAAWWQAHAKLFSANLGGVYAQPRYVIEQYSFVPYDLSPETLSKGLGYYYYRITARGIGSTNNAFAVLESMYALQFN